MGREFPELGLSQFLPGPPGGSEVSELLLRIFGDLIKSAFLLIAFTFLLKIKFVTPSHPKFSGHSVGSAYDKNFFLGGGRIFLLDLKIQRFS